MKSHFTTTLHHFDSLRHKFFEIAEFGAESDDTYELLMVVLDKWKEKIVSMDHYALPKLPETHHHSCSIVSIMYMS